MANLSLFQSMVSSCAGLLPRLNKEEQKEAVILFKNMLPDLVMGDTKDFDQTKATEENAANAQNCEVKRKESRWWKKRRSIGVFEESNVEESYVEESNVVESKRQRKKRKISLPSSVKLEIFAEKITERGNTEENTDASAKESTGESIEMNTEENSSKITVGKKEENTGDDTQESMTAAEKKVLDTRELREAAVAEILMLRKRLGQKPSKKGSSKKRAICQIGEKIGSSVISTSINVDEALKTPRDNIAEILPTIHINTKMVEVNDEIDADSEMMTKLDLFENDIKDEEELKRSLEAEDLEDFEEEGSQEKQTNEVNKKAENNLDTLDKRTDKATEKVGIRLHKRTRKGE